MRPNSRRDRSSDPSSREHGRDCASAKRCTPVSIVTTASSAPPRARLSTFNQPGLGGQPAKRGSGSRIAAGRADAGRSGAAHRPRRAQATEDVRPPCGGRRRIAPSHPAALKKASGRPGRTRSELPATPSRPRSAAPPSKAIVDHQPSGATEQRTRHASIVDAVGRLQVEEQWIAFGKRQLIGEIGDVELD